MKNRTIRWKLPSNNDSFRACINVFSQLILQGIGVAMAPIYTRLLSPEEYGITSIYAVFLSIVGLFVGLQTSASIANAHVYFSAEQQAGYRSAIAFLSILSLALISFVALLWINPISILIDLPGAVIKILLLHSFGTSMIALFNSICVITMQPIKQMLLSVVVALSGAFCAVLFINQLSDGHGFFGKILGNALPNIVIGFTLAAYYLGKGKTFYHYEYWKFCLPLCLPLIFHGLSQTILAQSDRIMLNNFSGSGLAGIYSLCYTVAIPINTIFQALNSTWLPRYYENMKQKKWEQIRIQGEHYRDIFTLLTTGFILVCPEGIKILAPSPYWVGAKIVPLVVASYFLIYLYSFPANHEFYYRKTKTVTTATMLSAALNIILNLLLIPRFSMMGAAIATLISYIFMFLFHEMAAKYFVKLYDYYSRGFYKKSIIIIAFVLFITYFIMDYWFIRWGLGLFVAFILACKLLKQKSIF